MGVWLLSFFLVLPPTRLFIVGDNASFARTIPAVAAAAVPTELDDDDEELDSELLELEELSELDEEELDSEEELLEISFHSINIAV